MNTAVRLGFICALSLSACMSFHEKAGDIALHNDDHQTAIRHYESGMEKDILMDFEFRRIQKKRLELVLERDHENLEEVEAVREALTPLDYAHALAEVRATARQGRTSSSFNAYITERLISATKDKQLTQGPIVNTIAYIYDLIDLYDKVFQTGAPKELLDHIIENIDAVLHEHLPSPSRWSHALDGIAELLALRNECRARLFPASLDPPIDQLLTQLSAQPPPYIAASNARERFDQLRYLRTQAIDLLAPKATVVWLAQGVATSSEYLLQHATQEADAHRYFAAVLLTQEIVAQAPPESPYHAALAQFQQQGSLFHQNLATQAPSGSFQALFHKAAAKALDASYPENIESAYRQLEPSWSTQWTYIPQLSGSCGAARQDIIDGLRTSPSYNTVTIQIEAQCTTSVLRSESTATANFNYQEVIYHEREVVDRYETRNTYIQRKFPCPFTDGTCTESVPTTETVPIMKTVYTPEVVTVEGSQDYTVIHHTNQLHAALNATLTFPDGHVIQLQENGSDQKTHELFDYTLPPEGLNGPPRHMVQALPSTPDTPALTRRATQEATQKLARQLHQEVRAYRAQKAVQDGQIQEQKQNIAGANEQFTASVLYLDNTLPEAAAFFMTYYGLQGPDVLRMLTGQPTIYTTRPGAFDRPRPREWQPVARPSLDDGYERRVARLEADTSELSTLSFSFSDMGRSSNVHNGTEVLRYDIGPRFFLAETANGNQHKGLLGNLHLHVGALGYLFKPGWGFAVLDELGVGIGGGVLVAGRQQYTIQPSDDGSADPEALGPPENIKEPLASWLLDADYTLTLGARAHYVSIFVGVRAGFDFLRHGNERLFGPHIEPTIRLAVRVDGSRQIIAQGYGLPTFIPNIAQKRGAYLSIPLSGRNGGLNLLLQWQQSTLGGSHRPAPRTPWEPNANHLRYDVFGLTFEARN